VSLLPLYLLNLEGAAPPPVVTPPRRLSLSLSEDNDLALALSEDNRPALTLTEDNRPEITLSETMSVAQNLSCIAGETVIITGTFDVPPTWNISTAGLAFYLKKAYSDTVALVTKTNGAGIVAGPDTTKQLKITLASADTKQTPGDYYYDVWHTDSGQETALKHGRFTIGPAVRP
jgi:hypothetical protein